jgi:hypothetical protein
VKIDANGAPERTSTTAADQAAGLKKQRTPMVSEIPLPGRIKSRHPIPAVILKLMADLHKSRRIRRSRMNLRRLSRAIYNGFDIKSENMARMVVEAHAEPVFLALDVKWSNSPIYGELEQILSNPEGKTSRRERAREIILKPRSPQEPSPIHTPSQILGLSLDSNRTLGRRKRPLQSEEDGSSTLPEDELESDLGSQRHRIGGRVKRRQSLADEILPRNHRLGKARAQASPSEASHTMTTRSKSSSDEDQNPITPGGRSGRRRGPSRSGKVAALRLIGSSPALKRFSPSLSDNETGEGGSRKRPRIPHLTISDDSEVTQSSNDLTPYLEADEFEEDEEEVNAMEGLTLTSEPILSSSPQGPNGLWSCQREGCDYQVAAADKPDGRAKVKAHFLQHADEIAQREALVLEESKPYLPTRLVTLPDVKKSRFANHTLVISSKCSEAWAKRRDSRRAGR